MFIFGGLIQSVNMINNKLETDKEFAHHFKLGVAEIENSWKNIMQRYLPFYVRRSIENLTDIRAKFYRSINLDENFIRSEALLEKLSALETCLEFPTQSTDDISKNDIVAAFRESISQFDNKQPFRSF